MKKLLLVTALTASFIILSATSAFAQEVSATVRTGGENNPSFDSPANSSFPDKEKLKEIHYQMVDNMMKDIIGTPKTNKRTRRHVIDSGEEWLTADIGGGVIPNTQVNYRINSIKIGELQFKTRCKFYSDHAEITSVSTEGTRIWAPGSLVSKESSISANNGRTVSSNGTFIIDYTSPSGSVSRYTLTFTTTISMKYVGNGTVHFTTRSGIREIAN